MIGGPTALVVALVLLPGWIYWRYEGSPRTSRSPLGELFEVVGAGALTSGLTALVYVLALDALNGGLWRLRLVDPTRATTAYVQGHLTTVALNAAVVVAFACALAWLMATWQRKLRAWKDDDHAKYEPDQPLWIRSLGSRDHVITVEMRDGRSATGYFGGNSVDDEGVPTIYLTPPIAIVTPSKPSRWTGNAAAASRQDFSKNGITIPGAEILAVWSPYADK